MKKYIIALALIATLPALACAKKPVKQAAEPVAEAAPVVEEAEPTITEECVANVSLCHESVKNKQFAEAYEPWWQVYTECPNCNKSIYTDGAKIVEALFAATDDPNEKERLAKLAIEMQDKRIKYFGKDPKYPTDYILGEKGMAYLDFYGDAKLPEARECLHKSIAALGAQSKIMNLVKLVDVSYALYKQNPDALAEQFIADYELASNALAEQAANKNNKNSEIAGKQKDYVDNIFAISGAADCSKLDEIYGGVVNENLSNLDMLQKIAKLYKRVRCTESDVYFAACEAAHKLQPTQESAAGCASMAAKKGEYAQAVAYYEQAIQFALVEDEMEDVADYQYNVAVYNFMNLKRYAEARKSALASITTLNGLNMTKGQGRCYILIGMIYAASQPYGEGMAPAKAAILNKTVFWVAVDKIKKAKQIDPTVEAAANEYINSYSKYFPTKEEIFDLPELQDGASFTVGGWIQETTTCRAAKQ